MGMLTTLVLALGFVGMVYAIPLVMLPGYMHFVLLLTVSGPLEWPLMLTFPFTLMKFVGFPFFVPFVLGWLPAMLYKLPWPKGHIIFGLFLALQLSPFVLLEEREVADVGKWGLKGPAKDTAMPLMGVWYFQGLPAGAYIDFSHCYWDPKGLYGGGSAFCYMPGLMSTPATPYNITALQRKKPWLKVTADFGQVGPPKEAFAIVGGVYNLGFTFYHIFVKNRLDFHFNPAGTSAHVFENICLLETGVCTSMTAANYFRTFMVHKHQDGYWDRGTYYNLAGYAKPGGPSLNIFAAPPVWPESKQPRCGGSPFPKLPLKQGDGYRLAPVLLPGKKVSKVNRNKVPTKKVIIRKAFRGSVLPLAVLP